MYEKWQLELPFWQTDIHVFVTLVNAAHISSDELGYLKLTDLRDLFSEPIWKPIWNDRSVLAKMLRHKCFKADKHLERD